MEMGWSPFISLSLHLTLFVCDREKERTRGCVSDDLRAREGVGISCVICKTKLKIVCAVHVVCLCERVHVCQPCFETVIRAYCENAFQNGA